MQVKRFFAADMRQAMKLVRDELGAEAAIIGNRRIAGGVELTAALDYKLSALSPRVPNMELEDELRKTQSRIVTAQAELSLVTLFGPDSLHAGATSDKIHAGALLVSDARLLWLPVRSLTSHTRYVTCPALLRRLNASALAQVAQPLGQAMARQLTPERLARTALGM